MIYPHILGGVRKALQISFFLLSFNVSAQTLYVDATNGNDAWTGTLQDAQSADGPLKTLKKVSDMYFSPGDSVLLKCGQTWNETLVVTSSGVAGSPITYGAYGDCTDNNKPVIDGSTPVNAWAAVGGGIYAATASLSKPPLNLIGNDTFDSGIATWSVWSSDGGATRSSMQNCGATGSCLLFTPSPGVPISLITTPIQLGVEANTTYRLTFVARASQSTEALGVFPRDAVSYSNIAFKNLALTTVWQTYTFDFIPAATHASARIDFQMPTGVNLYLDNVVIRRITPALDTAKQVFLDGQYQRLAQYPNKGFMSERPTNEFLKINNDSNDCSNPIAEITTHLTAGNDLGLTSAQQADLAGAGIHYRSNAWTIEDRTITAFDASTKTFSWTANSTYEICKDWGYYLDNKLWMLDNIGEWYYDATTSLLYLMIGASNPEGRVTVGHRDYGVVANGRTHVVFDGLSIQKAVVGISAQNGSNLIIRNTDITDSADKAINVSNSPDSEIVGCRIERSVRDGIWANYTRNVRISNNMILNTGIIGAPRKSIAAIHVQCWDCGTTVGNVVVEGNDIRRSGYLGIFMPVQATVRNNYIADSCMVLDDCGAIYTGGREFKSSGVPNNSQIANNVIINAWGNPDGRPANFASAAQGIYLDDFSNSVTVVGNTVVNADHGMQLHNAASNTVSNNVIYGSRNSAVWMQEDTSGSPGEIHDNLFSGNRYFQLNKGSTYRLDSSFNTINFANYDGNRYSLLYSGFVGRERYSPAGTPLDTEYLFQDWVSAKGDVSSTAFDAFGVALNRVLAIKSGNLVNNGSFDTDTIGWSKWSLAGDAHIDNVACVTGNCLKYKSGTTPSILSSPRFLITKGKDYRVRIDIRGELGNESVRVQLRLNGTAVDGSESYASLGLSEAKALASQWETYSFVFKATDSSPTNGARLDLETPTASVSNQPVFYVDNVLVDEVNADFSGTSGGSAIVINPTLSAMPKDCPDAVTNPSKCSQYVSFTDSTPVTWPITVEAMGSEIVIWNNNPFKDTDRDRIADPDDLCPGTLANAPVNEHGCSFTQQHSSDLGVTLVSPTNVAVGNIITYAITVTNAGPQQATNVVASGSLTSCSLGTIPSGGNATCTRSVTTTAVGVLNQTVSVSATEPDVNTSNNTATASTQVQGVLTVNKSGAGTGAVTSNPTGINCGTDCTELYEANTLVGLTASADTGSLFTGWSGDCTGTNNSCTVTMDASKTVTATFSGQPDLVVSALNGAASGTAGSSTKINVTTVNTGTAAAVSSVTGVYLSTDATITSADTQLGSVNVAGLAASTSSASAPSVTLPVGLVTGTYYLGAIADSTSVVTEGNAGNTGESNNAKIGNAIQISGVPVAPSALTATVNSKTKITLTWADNASNESRFMIERSTNGTTFTQIGSVGANVKTYVSSGLSAKTLYYYRVRASNARGNSAYSNTVSARTN